MFQSCLVHADARVRDLQASEMARARMRVAPRERRRLVQVHHVGSHFDAAPAGIASRALTVRFMSTCSIIPTSPWTPGRFDAGT